MENTTLLGQAIWGQRPEEGSWTVPVRWFVPGTGVARDDNLALFPTSENLSPVLLRDDQRPGEATDFDFSTEGIPSTLDWKAEFCGRPETPSTPPLGHDHRNGAKSDWVEPPLRERT